MRLLGQNTAKKFRLKEKGTTRKKMRPRKQWENPQYSIATEVKRDRFQEKKGGYHMLRKAEKVEQ